MAKKITASVLGGKEMTFDNVSSLQALKELMGLDGNYTVTINGEPAEMNDALEDNNFVTFTTAVKSGRV